MLHGDGKNQTTSVPHTRDYKRTAGDLNEGGCILVAYRVPKNKVKKKGAPNGKTTGAKLVRSCDADVFGQVGVYVSRLEAHAQLAAFREIISGKGRGGGSKPLAQRNQPAQSPSPTSTRSLTQTDDVAPERIDRIVHSCVERMVRAIVATTGVAADEFWSAGGTSALATVRRRAIDAVGHTNVHLLVKVDTPVPVPVPVAAPSLMGEWLSIQGPLFREAKRAAKRGGRRHSGTVKAAKRIRRALVTTKKFEALQDWRARQIATLDATQRSQKYFTLVRGREGELPPSHAGDLSRVQTLRLQRVVGALTYYYRISGRRSRT